MGMKGWGGWRWVNPGGFKLTMLPLVASPSRPPKVMTGDMQAQYRKRTEAKHCRLMASRTSLQ